ncbi:hypothetical protein YQE_08430, partial [Dendroctonus ponderosae]
MKPSLNDLLGVSSGGALGPPEDALQLKRQAALKQTSFAHCGLGFKAIFTPEASLGIWRAEGQGNRGLSRKYTTPDKQWSRQRRSCSLLRAYATSRSRRSRIRISEEERSALKGVEIRVRDPKRDLRALRFGRAIIRVVLCGSRAWWPAVQPWKPPRSGRWGPQNMQKFLQFCNETTHNPLNSSSAAVERALSPSNRDFWTAARAMAAALRSVLAIGLLAGLGGAAPPTTCQVGEFACATGRCVPSNRFCDTRNDCGDSSDEPRHCTRK